MTRDEWISMGLQNGLIDDVIDYELKTFDDCFRLWLCSKMNKIKPQSLDRIECTYNRYFLVDDISRKHISSLDEKYIINFIDSILIRYHVTHKEFGRIFQILNNVVNYCYDFNVGGAKLLDWNKVKRCSRYSRLDVIDDNKQHIVSDADRKAFINGVLRQVYSEKQSACLLLAMNFYLGLRIGELAALKFSDFDLNNNLVYIRRTEVKYYDRDDAGARQDHMHYQIADSLKTVNSNRTIPLLPECKHLLLQLKSWHYNKGYATEYLCYDGADTIASRSLNRTLTKLCKILELQHINSHLIRKTYASLLHQANVPTRVISDLLGHEDMSTTERCYILNYSHSFENQLDNIKKALAF